MNGNSYVTFIEEEYLKKCTESGDGDDIQTDWKSKKILYSEMTKTTVYEFMNYSMHDESHSINILENIEMILGKDRVKMLSRSDLWLLLNAAYAHDIGMVTEYKNLKNLWSDTKFIKFVKDSCVSLNQDDARSARFFVYLDRLFRLDNGIASQYDDDEIEFEIDVYDSWPLDFRKAITLLMTNFIRMDHGERSKKYFESSKILGIPNSIERLYKLVGKVSAFHSQSQEEIENIPFRCRGFGTDVMHPRFVAMLLRLGDLLDLDNNRFDIFSLKHFGPLPDISVVNFKKHKSIVHFHVSTTIVEVTAQSDDFDVCKLNQAWFQYLKEDIVYLITHWSDVAPEDIAGCYLGMPKLKVIHGKYEFQDNSIQGFVLEKQKLLGLFTGNNLYTSELDFIREYVQNALDASKLQLYYELRNAEIQMKESDYSTKKEQYLQNSEISIKNLRPFDLNKVAIEAYPIVIQILPDMQDENYFILRIIDRGIGIDKEGLEAIVNVGTGWRKRGHHQQAISEMRQWLRPTGGFGIGLQSAFMVTDEVHIYSKSAFEEGYRITLSKQPSDKNVIVEVDNSNIQQGTTAEFKIRYSVFDRPYIIQNYLGTFDEKDYPFDVKDRIRIICRIIDQYIKEQFPASLLPIKRIFTGSGKYSILNRSQIFESVYYTYSTHGKGTKKILSVPEYVSFKPDQSNEDNIRIFFDELNLIRGNADNIYINVENKMLRVWNDKEQIFYCFQIPSGEKVRIRANYKNILVKDNSKEVRLINSKHPEFVDITYDVLGLQVQDSLIVSRNAFRAEKRVNDKIALRTFIKAYSHMLAFMAKNNTEIPEKVAFYIALIERERKFIDEIVKNYFLTEDLQILTWELNIDGDDLKWNNILKSRESIFSFDSKKLWMVEMGNIEEDHPLEYDYKDIMSKEEGKKRYEIIDTKDRQDPIRLDDKFDTIAIIRDKKIFAILSEYKPEALDLIVKIGTERFASDPVNVYTLKGSKKEIKKVKSSAEPEKQNIKIEFEKNYIEISGECENKFKPLIVTRLPFKIDIEKKRYIILPYTKDIRMQFEKILENSNLPLTSLQEYLIRNVESWIDYKSLTQWVYNNQESVDHFQKREYTIENIQDAYRSFIRKSIEGKAGEQFE